MAWNKTHKPTANLNRRIFKVETKSIVKQLKEAGFSSHVPLSHTSVPWNIAKNIFCKKEIRVCGGTLKRIKAAIESGPALKEDIVLSYEEAMDIVDNFNQVN